MKNGLRYRAEAFAVQRRGAKAGEGVEVLGASIAFVAGEAVAGELAV